MTALALSSVALTACGGGKAISSPTSAGTTSSAAAAPIVQPLTCEKSPAPATTHPVYIAKIPNTASVQYGLGSADFVYEELVEGGITRLGAFYYSKLPSKAGPIRSTRLTDIALAKPLNAQIVTSGGAPPTIQGVQAAGITLIGQGAPHVYRVNSGIYGVMADIQGMGADAHQPSATPKTLLPCGVFKGAGSATNIAVKFSGSSTTRWSYAGGQYTMTNGIMAAGDVFHPNTIIVVKVDTTDAGYRDPAGNYVPRSEFRGTGKAIIFSGGKFLLATWHKDGDSSTPTFTDGKGRPVYINPGRTMLEMIPTGNDPQVPAGKVTY